jgi:hypothetical protein
MAFTSGQQKLLPYWGIIVTSVAQRASTADLWAAVRAGAQIEGNQLTGVRVQDMNVLRSIAASQQRSISSLQSLLPGNALDARNIGRDLSSRSLQDQSLAPRWIVRFEHDVVVQGQLQTLWRSSVFEGQLPSTKGDLMNALESDAAELAKDYDVTHVGIGRFSIAAV